MKRKAHAQKNLSMISEKNDQVNATGGNFWLFLTAGVYITYIPFSTVNL
jgi:hypothetical protein